MSQTIAERKRREALAMKKWRARNKNHCRRYRRKHYEAHRKPGRFSKVCISVASEYPKEKVASSYTVYSLIRLPVEKFIKVVGRIFSGDVVITNELCNNDIFELKVWSNIDRVYSTRIDCLTQPDLVRLVA